MLLTFAYEQGWNRLWQDLSWAGFLTVASKGKKGEPIKYPANFNSNTGRSTGSLHLLILDGCFWYDLLLQPRAWVSTAFIFFLVHLQLSHSAARARPAALATCSDVHCCFLSSRAAPSFTHRLIILGLCSGRCSIFERYACCIPRWCSHIIFPDLHKDCWSSLPNFCWSGKAEKATPIPDLSSPPISSHIA